MFDKYVTEVKSGPSRVDVHEHRAPTDDSVRLLREMEAKALANVTASFRTEGNRFKGSIIVRPDPYEAGHKMWALFDLNGEKFEVGPVPFHDSYLLDPRELFKWLNDELAKAIAGQLLTAGLVQLQPVLSRRP